MPQALFSFNGRMRRLQYIIYGIGFSLTLGIVQQALLMIIPGSVVENGVRLPSVLGLLVIILPMGLFGTWVGFAMAVQRVHDMGKSAVWVWPLLSYHGVFIILAVVASINAALLVAFDPGGQLVLTGLGMVMASITIIIGLLAFVFIVCLWLWPSQKTSNAFGPGPGRTDLATVF